MAVDLAPDADVTALAQRTAAFVREKVIPVEEDHGGIVPSDDVRSLQLCGALGVSGDLPLCRFLHEVRPFRVYDGPSEAHRWSIARRVVGHHTAASA